MSPIHLLLPDHTTRRFSSGEELTGTGFDKRYRVVEMRAVDNVIVLLVEETAVPEINALGEETFF